MPITNEISENPITKEKTAPGKAEVLRAQDQGRRIVYRANLPVMVLAFMDNHYAAVNIPAGGVFEVIGPAEDDRFVLVDVKGQKFLVFDSDLKCRCKPVHTRSVAAHASMP